ncbi:hypothetical protein DFH28DRAFT_995820 [Melampsora americana]|nr:hypothetical protein DFH28DRAFT_995820 [Melampsora americana]
MQKLCIFLKTRKKPFLLSIYMCASLLLVLTSSHSFIQLIFKFYSHYISKITFTFNSNFYYPQDVELEQWNSIVNEMI